MIETPFETQMREIAAEEEKFLFQVLGMSGKMYEVPKEVFDLVEPHNKRMVKK